MIEVARVDHVGVRVRGQERSLAFVELNLVYNANADAGERNILMDVGEKYPGYTHLALRIASIKAVIEALRAHG